MAMEGAIQAFSRRNVTVNHYKNPNDHAWFAIDARIAASPFAVCMPSPNADGIRAKLIRNILRLALCWGSDNALDHLLGRIVGARRFARWRLTRILRGYGPGEVIVLAHSAGGVLGASVAAEPAVRCLIGFGYPFRHPERGEERYRTRNLASIAKPFLIIQGDRDNYGNADAARRYPLSPQITVMRVDADHDYRLSQDADFARLMQTITDFALGKEQALAMGDEA